MEIVVYYLFVQKQQMLYSLMVDLHGQTCFTPVVLR